MTKELCRATPFPSAHLSSGSGGVRNLFLIRVIRRLNCSLYVHPPGAVSGERLFKRDIPPLLAQHAAALRVRLAGWDGEL